MSHLQYLHSPHLHYLHPPHLHYSHSSSLLDEDFDLDFDQDDILPHG